MDSRSKNSEDSIKKKKEDAEIEKFVRKNKILEVDSFKKDLSDIQKEINNKPPPGSILKQYVFFVPISRYKIPFGGPEYKKHRMGCDRLVDVRNFLNRKNPGKYNTGEQESNELSGFDEIVQRCVIVEGDSVTGFGKIKPS